MKDKYSAVIMEYLSKCYACKVDDEENQTNVKWYLCHHPVFHPQKSDKVGVVFDYAARFRGKSLNDELLQGPDITNSLVGVLIQFRKERVAIVSGIEAMFHQVRVDPKGPRRPIRFVWWPDGDMSQSPIDFRMLVHVFGATSSPSCPCFCLIQAAEDSRDGET